MSHERPSASPAAALTADENNLFLDIIHEAPLSGHRERQSIFGSALYCLLLAGYAVVAAAAPWIFILVPKLIPMLLCSCNVLILILTGVFQQYWVYQVKKVRLQGYYSFSQRLKHIAQLPFATITYGSALMLLVLVWQPYIKILSVVTLLRIVMLVEVICTGCFMSVYVGYIHQYNSLDGQPDILKPLYSALQPSSSLENLRVNIDAMDKGQILAKPRIMSSPTVVNYSFLINLPTNDCGVNHVGPLGWRIPPFIAIYYDGGRLSDQQMALLQYQRENLHYLNEEVLRLQECLSKYQRSDDGNAPQVDLAHLLASRDQELRALTAEMNQVQSELRLARNLIAERDTEVQHMQVTNNQYIEENERLRAILGEWSTRAAKLERALEAERLSNMELQNSIAKLRSKPTGQQADAQQS